MVSALRVDIIPKQSYQGTLAACGLQCQLQHVQLTIFGAQLLARLAQLRLQQEDLAELLSHFGLGVFELLLQQGDLTCLLTDLHTHTRSSCKCFASSVQPDNRTLRKP